MGLFFSKTESDEIKYKVDIDEHKYQKNIVKLYDIMLVLNKQYNDNVSESIKKQLEKEIPVALNFKLFNDRYADIYRIDNVFKIIKITNWHKHSNIPDRMDFSMYCKFLKDSDLSDCLCVLSNKQLEFYNFLTQPIILQKQASKS